MVAATVFGAGIVAEGLAVDAGAGEVCANAADARQVSTNTTVEYRTIWNSRNESRA